MKIPEHLKDEKLIYYYAPNTESCYYAFVKYDKRGVAKKELNNLLFYYYPKAPVKCTLDIKGNILLSAPLKDFLTLYPEHFL
jgi:hypothetical protein